MGSSKSRGCWILLVAVLALTSCSLPRTEGVPAQPAGATDAPKVQLGKLAFIRDGNLWAKDLPDGTAVQLTKDGGSREPRWSASGQWLSFSKSSPSGLEAWIARADGTEAHRLEPSSVSKGIWSPVRDEVAYGLKGGLYLVNADGSGRREVVPPSGKESVGATRLAWSPDGQWIAFEKTDASRAGPPLYQGLSYQGLWVVGADGSGAREVYANANPQDYQSYLAGWTPDGQSLLYWQGRHMSASMMADGLPLMEVPVSGGTPTQVSGTRMLAHPELLDWSRDGKLALIDGGFRESWEGKQIAVAEPGRLRMLSDKGRSDLFPAWSPDGSLIVLTGGPAAPGTPGGDDAKRAMAQRHLWLMQPDGSSKLQITSDPGFRDERPLWSKDGSRLLFGRLAADDRLQLWLMRSDGSDLVQVVDNLGLKPIPGAPAWFGYYGYVDWSSMYDWWRGGPSRRRHPLPRPPPATRLQPRR